MHIKKNDLVVVLSGRDKGRRGKVLEVQTGRSRVIVEGVNMVKRHVRAGSDPKAPQGGIIEVAAPIHISNVRIVCKHCNQPTNLSTKRMEDGKKTRICKKCKESIDK
ncbi:MAG: 50S ribosomal protein L24 [Deltaproteobacteria bacterium]|nr:50S ribosomal protein L24 [Deltaproteobacteria bacterium]